MPPQKSLFHNDYRAEIDRLNFDDYKPALLDILLEASTPLTVGIFGPWGSGKTSLLYMLREQIEHNPKDSVRSTWITAWKYERQEALWRAFILRVLEALYPREEPVKGVPSFREDRPRIPVEKLKDQNQKDLVARLDRLQESVYRPVDWQELGRWSMDWWRMAQQGAQGAADVAAAFFPAADLFKKVLDAFGGKEADRQALQREVKDYHLEQLLYLEQFERTFSEVVRLALGERGRLVVFVDDLDRCLPEKALEVLEAIKLFLEVEGVVFVLGMDREVVERGVQARYREWFLRPGDPEKEEGERPDLPISGEAYLQKMIQIPFHLPPLRSQEVEKYLQDLEGGFEHKDKLSERTRQVLARGLYPNPRQAKRVVNILRLVEGLIAARSKRSVEDGGLKDVVIARPLLAKTILIQQQFPKFYREWRSTPTLAASLEEAYRRYPLDPERQIRRAELAAKIGQEEEAETPPAKETDPVPAEYRGGWLDKYLRERGKYTLLEKLLAFTGGSEPYQESERAHFAGLTSRQVEVYLYLVSSAEAVPVEEQTAPPGVVGSASQDLLDLLLSGDTARINEAADRVRQEEQVPVYQPALLEVLEAPAQKTAARVSAGNALARLGDPRFDPERWYLPFDDDGLFGFVHIPAGPFEMGSDKDQDLLAADDETPRHSVELPGYYLARYPVTVAQFAEYIRLHPGGSQVGDRALQGRPNHPVTELNWHEALAYCQWLEGVLRELAAEKQHEDNGAAAGEFWRGLASRTLRVTLPGEAEWEKAARGDPENQRQHGIYPWGDEFNNDYANTSDSGLGTTSPVGCFPGGASPYGLLDMSGNVWEWTRSQSGDYPYPTDEERRKREDLHVKDDGRVLRGGSFFDSLMYARCACRVRYNPFRRLRLYGFRVAVVPANL